MSLFETQTTGSNGKSAASRSPSRVGLSFGAQVAPDTTERITHTVKADATIESVDMRFYQGPRLDLRVSVFVEHEAEEGTTDVVKPVGKSFVDGDDDTPSWETSTPVGRGDTIVVKVTNVDTTHSYNTRVNMSLDRENGLERAIGAVKGAL